MLSPMPRTPALFASSIAIPVSSRHELLVHELTTETQRLRSTTKGITRLVLEREDAACRWLIESLHQGYNCIPPSPITLSRSKGAYSLTGPGGITHPYAAVGRVLAVAQSLGWILRQQGENQPYRAGSMARWWPSGSLLQHFEQVGRVWGPRASPPREGLILLGKRRGDRDRQTVPRDRSPTVAVWQDDLHRINALIGNTCIYLDLPDDRLVAVAKSSGVKGPNHLPDGFIDFAQTALRRIFARGQLGLGGRFYGGWWQQIPSAYRRHIVIGDQLTVECDYSGMALRCLYAEEGIPLDEGDPYDIGLGYSGNNDPRRHIVKQYVNACLNDEKGTYRPDKEKLRLLGMSAATLKAAVAKKHARISHHFHTGVGLHLQFIDSEIAMAVMLRLADEGEVCLPVHDSFIVRGGIATRLKAVMQDEFLRITGSPALITADTIVDGERMGLPTFPAGTPPNTTGIVDALNDHFNKFSITQAFHACFWEHQAASR
jgi:hypothetical protein